MNNLHITLFYNKLKNTTRVQKNNFDFVVYSA